MRGLLLITGVEKSEGGWGYMSAHMDDPGIIEAIKDAIAYHEQTPEADESVLVFSSIHSKDGSSRVSMGVSVAEESGIPLDDDELVAGAFDHHRNPIWAAQLLEEFEQWAKDGVDVEQAIADKYPDGVPVWVAGYYRWWMNTDPK